VYSLITFSDTLIPKSCGFRDASKEGGINFLKRGIHAVLFFVFKMVSTITIKMRHFYPILSRFSDEMGVGGRGGPTPSFLDPSMLIYL
jgi:hypothetical protein